MIVDNIHKWRFIRSLLCRIGRHDYEFDKPIYEGMGIGGRGKLIGAELRCFYCWRLKCSYLPWDQTDEG